jgi:ketopantoate hydroxymethyltransferase
LYDELLEAWKKKKKQKEKIFIFSFINNSLLDIYNDFSIDVFRFDLYEYSLLYGYKDINRISQKEILPLLNKLPDLKKGKDLSKLIAVDLPLTEIFGEENFSLQNVIDYYNKSRADLLILNIDHNILGLTNKLSKIKIPTIINSKNNLKTNSNDYLETMYTKLIESESQGALMILVEDYPQSFINNLKNAVSIPVICNLKSNKIDGYYARFSTVFGLIESEENRYLNLSDLIHDSVEDYIKDIK